MKKLKLLFSALLLGCMLGLSAQAPGLIFSEWTMCQDVYSQYMELTNMEDTAINLNDFQITHYGWWDAIPAGTTNPANRIKQNLPFKNYYVGADSMLGPKESIVIAVKSERIWEETGFTTDRDPVVDIADLLVYVPDHGLAVDVKDSVTHAWVFRGGLGDEATYLFYFLPNGDSIPVDAINNNIDPATNKIIRQVQSSIAGVDRANRHHAMVRKANITSGNLNWDLARGTDLTDSEWLPIPYDSYNANWNPSLFTTVGTHGDNSIDFDSETLAIDHDNKTITVPWGYRRATFNTGGSQSYGIAAEIDFGQGMSYWYHEHADSSSSACQDGDLLEVYACGNDLEKAVYSIVAAPAADNNALVLPKRTFDDETNMAWAWGGAGDVPATLAEPYTVTEGMPGMDTISGIVFAERTDTLMTYIEIAPEATSSFVFVDGEDRVDLKEGDILRITAKDGSTKDYYLALEELEKSENANLASITWPELPYEMDGWNGDTIPGFAPGVVQYNFTVPYGINNIPALAVTAEDMNALVKVERATDIGGSFEDRTTTITVTSQDSSVVKVYAVIFEAEKLEDDLQPFKAEPIISEFVLPWTRTFYVEIANVGNQDIDLSEYVFINSFSDNPANAISEQADPLDSAVSYTRRYAKYIPGYKYGSYDEWKETPGAVKLDPDMDPILKAGECFVMGGMKKEFLDENNGAYTDPSKYDIHWSEDPYANIHGDMLPTPAWAMEAFPRAAAWAGASMYIFKINPDSAAAIYDGSKGISDPGDFILVDRLGGEAGTAWNVAGNAFNNGQGIWRKPHAYLPYTDPKGGFGTNADDSDWIWDKWQNRLPGAGNMEKIGDMQRDLKNYTHDAITFYMSFVNSTAYIVDAGYEGNLEITGVLPNTNVTSLESNIIKMDDGQVLKVLSSATAGDTLAAADMVTQGDTLLVISANGENKTKYYMNVGALDSDAVLVAKDGSGYVVDINGETASITGVAFESSLDEILSKLEKPALALLNVVDAENNLVPLKVLNLSDSTYKETLFTGGVFLEVVAQDKSKITYELIANVASSDAWLSSNSYTVNQLNKGIYDVPEGVSVEIFMSNIFAAGGATLELLDKAEFSRDSGYIALDDIIRVTSEDGSSVVDYTLRLIGYEESSLAYVTSEIYTVDADAKSIGDIPKDTDVDAFLGNVVPALGAHMVLKDAAGADKVSGMILTGDVLSVSSEDGSNSVDYTTDVLVSTELNVFEGVNVYPNPVSDVLNITGLKQQTRVELISLAGQVLRSDLTSDNAYVLDMSSQRAGYYILRISDSDQNTRVFNIVCTKQ
ncbi:MAG: T9SS type A sorting domain-containing protein [Bacteroidetes bacterium]|nr:T9SS type A sorting domain-containing protein [Bacteroidota bacterium]